MASEETSNKTQTVIYFYNNYEFIVKLIPTTFGK